MKEYLPVLKEYTQQAKINTASYIKKNRYISFLALGAFSFAAACDALHSSHQLNFSSYAFISLGGISFAKMAHDFYLSTDNYRPKKILNGALAACGLTAITLMKGDVSSLPFGQSIGHLSFLLLAQATSLQVYHLLHQPKIKDIEKELDNDPLLKHIVNTTKSTYRI